jgi:hypothetical protein
MLSSRKQIELLTMEKQIKHPSGAIRSCTESKIDYSSLFDGPMADRYAKHMTEAAKTKGKKNWMKAHTEEDLERFVEGALRHIRQWYRGDTDEDHAAAVIFNIFGAEHVKEQLNGKD